MGKKNRQALHFLGTGNAFSKHPNNAYMRPDEETLVFIDLDARNFVRARNVIERSVPKRIYVLVTHMHNDHVSGIATLAEWLYYKYPDYTDNLYISAPGKLLVRVLRELFESRNLTDAMVTPVTAESLCREAGEAGPWLLSVIPTTHVGLMFEGLCFGYLLSVKGKRILYSGDTNTLEPFLGISCDEFYCDMSDFGGGDRPHLCWNLDKEALIEKARGCDVFLMHMDRDTREKLAEEILQAGLFIAER